MRSRRPQRSEHGGLALTSRDPSLSLRFRTAKTGDRSPKGRLDIKVLPQRSNKQDLRCERHTIDENGYSTFKPMMTNAIRWFPEVAHLQIWKSLMNLFARLRMDHF